MAGRVEKAQRAAGQLDRHVVGGLEDTLGRDRHQRAVGALDLLGAVDRGRALHEVDRIDQVARTARMNDESGLRKLRHQQARTAGMVEMDVGRDHVVDRVDAKAHRLQGREQPGHRVVRSGVDERRAVAFDDQVGGVEARAVKAGVDDVDAMTERRDEVGH